MNQQLIKLDPNNYTRHNIHTRERDWAETNCYADVWIEQLHALGFEPTAALAFTIGIDFEGDQWTFFKFPLQDLRALYGIEVQELAVWKPIIEHAQQQLAMGRAFLVELDSKYLPDTAGTAYQENHVKTSVSINALDIENQTMDYFHAQGYYRLQGQDFDNVFRINNHQDPAYLPPYIEIAKLHNTKPLNPQDLLKASLQTLKREVFNLPIENPFFKFKQQLSNDLEWLGEQDMETFHAYSFATLRQFGACFELAALYLSWLADQGETGLTLTINNFKALSESAKVYQFQLARTISRRKPLDLASLDKMAELWQQATNNLKSRY